MNVGDSISVSGYITKEKFIAGRTLAEVEKILGFHPGRLSKGMAMAVLMELPGMQQFELRLLQRCRAPLSNPKRAGPG
jgi:hypothetical protein